MWTDMSCLAINHPFSFTWDAFMFKFFFIIIVWLQFIYKIEVLMKRSEHWAEIRSFANALADFDYNRDHLHKNYDVLEKSSRVE